MSGVLAGFASEEALQRALVALRREQISNFETYTPTPLEDSSSSPLPLIIFAGGMIGTLAGFGMQTYADTVSYPLDIGGRPELSWPAFVPITFEIAVLFAVLSGFIGYFFVNRMPRLYEPIDECRAMRNAMADLWLVAVRSDETTRVHQLLRDLRPAVLEALPA